MLGIVVLRKSTVAQALDAIRRLTKALNDSASREARLHELLEDSEKRRRAACLAAELAVTQMEWMQGAKPASDRLQ